MIVTEIKNAVPVRKQHIEHILVKLFVEIQLNYPRFSKFRQYLLTRFYL